MSEFWGSAYMLSCVKDVKRGVNDESKNDVVVTTCVAKTY